jgi:hypothetical protein
LCDCGFVLLAALCDFAAAFGLHASIIGAAIEMRPTITHEITQADKRTIASLKT